MAQAASATLKANAAATARVISRELRIAWGRTAATWPTDWATQSSDETARVLDLTLDRRLSLDSALGRGAGPVAQLRVTLDNYDQRFSPYNSAGPLYANISGTATTPGGASVRYPRLWMTPVRLRMGFYDTGAGHEYLTVFSGLIDYPSETYGLDGEQVALVCLDRGAALLDVPASSIIHEDVQLDAWLRYLVSTRGGIATGQTLDRAFFSIPFAWLDDERLWSEVQQAAASEGGNAFFDETGEFQYRNAAWWATAADSIATTNTAIISAQYAAVRPDIDHKALATGCIVEYQPRAHGGEQIVWRSNETITVPPGSKTVEARFSYPVSILLTPASPGDWLPVSSGGLDMTAKISLDIQEQTAQRANLVFVNEAQQTVFIPKMQLRGLALIGGPQEQVDVDAAAALVPTNKPRIGGNPYIQTKGQAQLVAALIAYRNSYPRLTYHLTGVPALPWLQLGDRIGIDLQEHSGTTPISTIRYGIITSLVSSWRPDGAYLMDIEAVDVAGLYEYDNYHVLGTTNYGAGVAFV